jgi:hypothetical protein
VGTRKEDLTGEVGEKRGGKMGKKRGGKVRRQEEMDIFRTRSYKGNADNVWLAEVVNCTVVADLGPLVKN